MTVADVVKKMQHQHEMTGSVARHSRHRNRAKNMPARNEGGVRRLRLGVHVPGTINNWGRNVFIETIDDDQVAMPVCAFMEEYTVLVKY